MLNKNKHVLLGLPILLAGCSLAPLTAEAPRAPADSAAAPLVGAAPQRDVPLSDVPRDLANTFRSTFQDALSTMTNTITGAVDRARTTVTVTAPRAIADAIQTTRTNVAVAIKRPLDHVVAAIAGANPPPTAPPDPAAVDPVVPVPAVSASIVAHTPPPAAPMPTLAAVPPASPGLTQVRDTAGHATFVTCRDCVAPTPKTPVQVAAYAVAPVAEQHPADLMVDGD